MKNQRIKGKSRWNPENNVKWSHHIIPIKIIGIWKNPENREKIPKPDKVPESKVIISYLISKLSILKFEENPEIG